MIAADEDALICDFAETYHIYNFRSLPPGYAATLACGLRDDSRIKKILSGQRASIETLLQAATVDALNLLVWMRTKDGAKNRNRPESVVEKLTQMPVEKNIIAFNSAEEFERVRSEIIRRANNA